MDPWRYLILGGGVAAGYAAKEFAKRGVAPGELAIISAETTLPYDRPPLSKAFLAGKKERADILIADEAFYRDHGIAVFLNRFVDGVDLPNHVLRVSRTGEDFGYQKLLIATGSAVNRLPTPGGDLDGIHYLRTIEDSQRIRDHAAHAVRTVIIGGSFIAMEVSSVLAQKGLPVTMVFPESRIWEAFFSPRMSEAFGKYYGARGVTILPGQRIARFEGDGSVSGVRLESGEVLPADLVVAGVGVRPALDVLRDTGLTIGRGILVDEYLESNVPDVYAAGDVAEYRDVVFGKQRLLAHWDTAVQHARRAVRNMMGSRKAYSQPPYFFSDEFDLSYEFWGDTEGADTIVHRGDVEGMAFSTWWLKQGVLIATFVLNRPDEERENAPKWIAEHRRLAPSSLEDAGTPLTSPQSV
ncbi:MAG: NAD(P)/FAD-dependent oxidoreductase [Anaerolineae bacterium]